MDCCNNGIMKELLNDCHKNNCGCGEHKCDPIFDIASPIEGQILVYSEIYKAFMNQMPTTFTQVQVDWNAIDGISSILNKPALFSGSWNDLSNKPILLFFGSIIGNIVESMFL